MGNKIDKSARNNVAESDEKEARLSSCEEARLSSCEEKDNTLVARNQGKSTTKQPQYNGDNSSGNSYDGEALNCNGDKLPSKYNGNELSSKYNGDTSSCNSARDELSSNNNRSCDGNSNNGQVLNYNGDEMINCNGDNSSVPKFPNNFNGDNFNGHALSNNFNGDKLSNNFNGDKLSNNFNGDKLSNNCNGDEFSDNFNGDLLSNNFNGDKLSNNCNGDELSDKCNGDVLLNNFNGVELSDNCNGDVLLNNYKGDDTMMYCNGSVCEVGRTDEVIENVVGDRYSVHLNGQCEDEDEFSKSEDDEPCEEENVCKRPGSPQKHKRQTFQLRDPSEIDKLRKIYEQRPYQVEIVEKSLKGNTIVCLGTGTGKTFISVSVIKEMQGGIKGTYKTNGKRTFFLVNTVPLVYQQAQVIKSTTCLNVGTYTGDMKVDFWSKEMWHEQFDNHDILVMTCQILVNILTHAFIGLRNINLLILDECHNATKNHPYAQLFNFYDQCPKNDQPQILGLTASIINKKYKRRESTTEDIQNFVVKNMKRLEVRMRSRCVTCADPTATEKYATKPIEIITPYSLDRSINGFNDVYEMANPEGSLIQSLYSASKRFKSLQIERENTVDDVMDRLTAQVEYLELEAIKARMPGNFDDLHLGRNGLKINDGYLIAADATKLCADIICELGPLCGYEAAKILIKQLSKNKELHFKTGDEEVTMECTQLLNNVKNAYEECVKTSPFDKPRDVKPMEPFITKKAYTFLTEILLREKNYFKETLETELHAIVFVERRCTAVILDKLINFQARLNKEHFEGIRSRHVLGHNMDTHLRLADSCMTSADQNKVIKEFKSGTFSVLVATSVIEEGLDVRKCNLVVRFDGLGNYRQYAQSKGRARSTSSKFVVMSPSLDVDKMKLEHEIMQEIESVLTDMCHKERTVLTQKEIEEVVSEVEDEYTPTYYAHDGPDAARINHNTAIALLHRYCSFLPSDQFSNTTPHFEYATRGIHGDEEFQATVYLPMNFPLEDKVYVSEWFPDKRTCKKSLSLIICVVLHTAGELNRNLLPVRHLEESEDDDEVDEIKPKEGTRKSQDYYHRKFPDVLSPMGETFDILRSELFVISVVLVEPRDRPSSIALKPLWNGTEKKGFGILLPPGVPKELPPIKIYTRAGGLIINFRHIANDNSSLDRTLVCQFHTSMMEICATKHVLGKHLFDIEDSRVSKGLIVPLKPFILDALKANTFDENRSSTKNVIDVDGIYNYVVNGGDIGRNNDEGMVNAIINKTYLNEQQNRRLYYIASISDQQGKDVMEGEITYTYYYESKYDHIISEDAILLEAVPCPSRVNFSEDMTKKDAKKQSTYKPERLVPALCRKAFRTHAHLHQQLNVFPYIYYFFESILNAYELRARISHKLGISADENVTPQAPREVDLSKSAEKILEDMLCQSLVIDERIQSPTIMEILETLTTRQAKFPYDLERLEMLGDSFLKQAVTIYLYFKYPKAHEGILSSKRKRCISNKNLCRVAKSVGIQHVICNSQFGNVNPNNENKNSVTVWLPPGYYREDDDVMEKLELDFPEYNDDDILHITEEDIQNDVRYVVQSLMNGVIAECESQEQFVVPKDVDVGSGREDFNNVVQNLVNGIIAECESQEQSVVPKEVDVGGEKGTSDDIQVVSNDVGNDMSDLDDIVDNGNIVEDIHVPEGNEDDEETDKKNEENEENEETEKKNASPRKHDVEIHISKDLPFQLVQDKTLADCVEAQIGLYFKVGGTNLALELMQKFLSVDVLYEAIAEKENCTVQVGTKSHYADFPKQHSAIQNSYSTYEDVEMFYERMKLSRLEEILGYTFQDKSFIVQAMTHLSYTTNDVTGCYQQTEFLGDAILDFLITLHIYVHKPDLSPGDLTSLRSALVNNNTFGLLVIKFEFDRFLKHLSPKLQNAILEFLSVANNTPRALDICFENPFVIVPDNSEEGYHAPKVLGDIFESIIGAVFLDSHLNLVKTWEIIYPLMKPIIDKYMEKIPLNPIREFYEKHVDGELTYQMVDDEMVVCIAQYGNNKMKTGMGKSRRIAKSTVCYKALYGC